MTERMRAKFYCEKIEDFGNFKTAYLKTQYSDTPEDNMFNDATPSGDMKIHIDKKGAMNFLKPGKQYYLDFTEVIEN